jgi:hypothetical protein
LCPSPYLAVQYLYLALEFAMGNRRCPKNPLRWDRVILNLPRDPKFDPSQPTVMKWNEMVERIAGDIVGFVDDLRLSGFSIENAWAVARFILSRLQYLGIQDAARKRRPPSQTPGAWAGAIFKITPERISKSISQAKWDKGAKMIDELLDRFQTDDRPKLEHKDLERKRGFLGHVAMTFPALVPFMKGFHLTIDSWRDYRPTSGWKMNEKVWSSYVEARIADGDLSEEEARAMQETLSDGAAPKTVQAVPRFKSDLQAMKVYFGPPTPPEITDRVSQVLYVMYGFGDASGTGFGSSIQSSAGLSYRIGVWLGEERDETSNFREFRNVVEALEDEGESGRLKDCRVFFCTDNSTVESAIYKGSSGSEKLHALVVRYHCLESKYGITVTTSHVSGKRMIAQGADGLSRGLLNEGVMAGDSIISFVPFHLSAVERSPAVFDWVSSWADEEVLLLSPEGWFERGHDQIGGQVRPDGFWCPEFKRGCYLWAPPPAAADVALEELRVARLKRQASFHIFVCPRLMTPQWLKQLYKASDIVFVLPLGSSAWPSEMFEPCVVGLIFPFLSVAPWQLRGSPKMYAVGRQLHKVWKDEALDAGNILRELCVLSKRLQSVPVHVVRKLLYL